MAIDQDDAKLAAKIVDAMKEVDAADATRKEKWIAAGTLLAEAQKQHPGKREFEKFLELAGGIGIQRAKDLIAVALGRKDFEQHQIENAAAQQRHRDKLKAEREKAKAALPKPEPKKPEPNGKGKPGPAKPGPSVLRNTQSEPEPARYGNAQTVSLVELIEKLTPIVKKLKEQGLKNMATMSPAAVAIEAGKLQNLLDEWRQRDVAIKKKAA